jgi:hypothetical protein
MEHRDRCSIKVATALYGAQGQMQHTDGHCTVWNTGIDAAYRWPLYCMEHRDRFNIEKATALYGTQGQMQHADGHCTVWNTGTDVAYR